MGHNGISSCKVDRSRKFFAVYLLSFINNVYLCNVNWNLLFNHESIYIYQTRRVWLHGKEEANVDRLA